MEMSDAVIGVVVGLGLALIAYFVLRLPPNEVEEDDFPDEEEEDDGTEAPVYDPAAPDPWEAEIGETEPLRDVDTLIDVLRAGEPAPCRKAVRDLVSHGADALPALRAAAEEGDTDLRIDAERAIALIEEETGP